MIIDLILERKDCITINGFDSYCADEFYCDTLEYGNHKLSEAMDYGTEADVKNALCDYIDSNNYNPEIKTFINNVKWI